MTDTHIVTSAVSGYVRGQNRLGSLRTGQAVTEIQLADNDPGRLDVER